MRIAATRHSAIFDSSPRQSIDQSMKHSYLSHPPIPSFLPSPFPSCLTLPPPNDRVRVQLLGWVAFTDVLGDQRETAFVPVHYCSMVVRWMLFGAMLVSPGLCCDFLSTALTLGSFRCSWPAGSGEFLSSIQAEPPPQSSLPPTPAVDDAHPSFSGLGMLGILLPGRPQRLSHRLNTCEQGAGLSLIR